MNSNLTHHGILGMKWGVRRSKSQLSRISGKASKKNWSEDAKTAKDINTKKTSQMSNAELRKLNERRQLENQHKQLNQNKFKKGVAFVATATAVMGTAINFYNSSNTVVKAGKSVGTKITERVGNQVTKEITKGFAKGL